MIGRLFSLPDDPEANLAARVRQGTVPITHTGRGALPSKIKERDQETRGKGAPGSSGNETSESSGARTEGEVEAGGPGTWTPARSARREIVFFDEVTLESLDPKGK